MANVDAPVGFRPVRQLYGSSWTGATIDVVIAAANTTPTFVGDFVELAGGDDTFEGITRATVQQHVADQVDIYGLIVGFEPNYSDLTVKHRSTLTRRIAHMVVALPGVVFEGQLSVAWTAGDIGLNANVVVGSGDTLTGRSTMELANPATGAASLKVIGASFVVGESLDTAAAGTNAYVLVNESIFGAGIDGA